MAVQVKKIVLMNSGGLDSLACAMVLKNLGFETHSLHLGIGQMNRGPAKRAARKIAKKYCTSHTYLRIFPWRRVVHLNKLSSKDFWCLPFQGHIVCTIGAAWARTKDINFIASGSKVDIWPLEADRLFEDFMRSSNLSTPVVLLRPLRQGRDYITTFAIVQRDMEMASKTVSCRFQTWRGPCGECPKCERRKRYSID
jgi:7-cyano-7-deazaguanine synthase in queuosine biosynthesis